MPPISVAQGRRIDKPKKNARHSAGHEIIKKARQTRQHGQTRPKKTQDTSGPETHKDKKQDRQDNTHTDKTNRTDKKNSGAKKARQTRPKNAGSPCPSHLHVAVSCMSPHQYL